MTTVRGKFDDVAISPFMRAVVKCETILQGIQVILSSTQLRDLVALAPTLHASRSNERHIGFTTVLS